VREVQNEPQVRASDLAFRDPPTLAAELGRLERAYEAAIPELRLRVVDARQDLAYALRARVEVAAWRRELLRAPHHVAGA